MNLSFLPEVSPEVLMSVPMLVLLGLCIGSFLNVVIYRVPVLMERDTWVSSAVQLTDATAWQRVFGAKVPPPVLAQAYQALETDIEALPALGIAKPRSRCPACGHAIAWHENIPLLGWLRLKGKCSACGTRISARYPLVELFTGVLFGLIGWRFGAQWTTLLWCGFAAVLVALAGIDWDTTYLPDSLTLPLLWAGLIAASFGWTGLTLSQALWGAAAGYLSLWSVYWLFKLVTGKEGMGYGDFKLLAALGAWLGPAMIVPILLMASVVGAVVGLAMKARQSLREGRYVPFGPFLVGGGLIVLLVGSKAIKGFLGWA
jgi:leader peptidase (prepilin peptidase)/N-methyltransferase